jgi:hypothetical protein
MKAKICPLDSPRKSLRSIIAILMMTVVLAGAAVAGQDCVPRHPSPDSMKRDLALAASVAEQLDDLTERRGIGGVLIARAGQDLGRYGLRYSHLGIAYKDATALGGRGAWRVVHKLNQCGTDRSVLYRQGLAEFFSDGLFRHEAGVVVIKGNLARHLPERLGDNDLIGTLHEPRYNMLAYPWSGPYQQSNQWAIETLAMLIDQTVVNRDDAKDWLRNHGYRPTTLHISALTRLGARLSAAHISFSDHPFDRRMAGRIDTVTVDSVFSWMQHSGLGEAPLRLQTRPLQKKDLPRLMDS